MQHHRAGLARLLDEKLDSSPQTLAWLDAIEVLGKGAREGGKPEFGAAFDDRQRALLRYALKLTASPWTMSASDVQDLRAQGLDDGEILDANQVTAYFAYANRLVDGLGVELEDA